MLAARSAEERLQEAAVSFRLHLSYCRLRSVQSRVWELGELTLLDLGHNALTALPPEVGRLLCLRELWLNHNPGLTSLPPELATCKQLALLDVRSTGMVKLPRELARLPELFDLRLDDCPALNAKQAAAFVAGGTGAVQALLAAKAARSDAKLALSEVLMFQLYTADAATDAGKLQVLALVKAVVASFRELADLRLVMRNAARLFPRSLPSDIPAAVAEVQRRHDDLCADNARKRAAAEVELSLRKAFFGRLDREQVEPLVARVMAALPALSDVSFFLAHAKQLLPAKHEDVSTERLREAAAALTAQLSAERATAVAKLTSALRGLWLHSTSEEVDAAVAAVAPLVERSVDLRALAADAAELFPPDPRGLVPAEVVRAFMDARRTKGLA